MKFYYIDEITKQQCGPYYLNELKAKNIRLETLIWRSGMPDWVEARNIKELSFLFEENAPQPNFSNNTPPPINDNQAYYQWSYGQGRLDDMLPMPKSWLLESILVTLFCCLPLGIIGIIYASKTESSYRAGNYEEALSNSNTAKLWTIIGFASMIVILFISFMFIIFAAAAS